MFGWISQENVICFTIYEERCCLPNLLENAWHKMVISRYKYLLSSNETRVLFFFPLVSNLLFKI